MKTLKTLPILISLLFFFNSSLWSLNEKEKPVLKDEVKIKSTSVKDQESSGMCWSFAAVSFLESEILRKGFSEMDLSEMYYVRQMYLQRGIDYIRYHGNLNFGYGGHAHDVLNQFGFTYGSNCDRIKVKSEMNFTAIIVDSIDEVAPSSSKKLLELLTAYKQENPAKPTIRLDSLCTKQADQQENQEA